MIFDDEEENQRNNATATDKVENGIDSAIQLELPAKQNINAL